MFLPTMKSSFGRAVIKRIRGVEEGDLAIRRADITSIACLSDFC